MQVTVEMSDTIVKIIDIDFAWELFYLYQKGAELAGEKITATRRNNWKKVELALTNAKEGDVIDFRLMGDIYYTNGGPQLDNAD